MYIAFRWLLGLSLLFWTAVCSVDIILKKNKHSYTGINVKITKDDNITLLVEQRAEDHHKIHHTNYVSILHYITFFAGILTVSVYNRKLEIVTYTKTLIFILNSYITTKDVKLIKLKNICIQLIDILMRQTKIILAKLQGIPVALKAIKIDKHRKLNLIMLSKLKEIVEERRNLGQLLVATIHENKTIRAQYQLESMARNRLMRHAEDTQRLIKENRSKYISFQQLYQITHQENIFLKARLVKLTKDKEEVERNLFGLIDEVYQSKNNELKAYCSHFIVNTKHNLLNTDAKAEIRKFLDRSIQSTPTIARKFNEPCDIKENTRECFNEISQDLAFAPTISRQARKLTGLPREYVWTVKNKDGIIEKIYECVYDSDNSDVIRRIRQYSVYYDKDCLLDFVNSKTVIQEIDNTHYFQGPHIQVEYPIATHRLLTGSEAFRAFLEKLKNVISFSSSSAHQLTYDL